MEETNGITIRTDICPGDLGTIIYLHGILYKDEYNYGISFESIVATGLSEFYNSYNPEKERIWIIEDNSKIVGCLLLKNRGETAQLRYFVLAPEYRGLGLGNRLMQKFMEFAKDCQYKDAYLWTTNDLDTAHRLYKKYGITLTEEKPSHEFGKFLIEQRYDCIF
ncbi:GNAT family N-acetyltransferase [Sphingobacterium sp. SRCM116780]|uniref:GNAT family N-acetyltransferase n=1 Tax=Sphingobacterium sp. SRCM116780 TaxID=2907623 RepID=UPI001F3CDA92|nr:GNAT family N-acetyltransferase [Sphingobacterium sp. SRCM116780]UIR54916.1 GNAT family N-acetyltransferase [Sphingobacterium sp. SRCM116780]